DGSTATHLKTWSSTFTADVPGSIQFGSPLPSGTWNIAGASTWTRGDRTYSLSVTTNPPLHYNADCSVAPKFDAGTISAVVTRRRYSHISSGRSNLSSAMPDWPGSADCSSRGFPFSGPAELERPSSRCSPATNG